MGDRRRGERNGCRCQTTSNLGTCATSSGLGRQYFSNAASEGSVL